MYTRGRRLRFTAVSAMVVLALTGFSSGRHHGSRGHHSGGGGGCSSSSQDHDSSSSSTSGGGGSYDSSSSGADAYGSGTSTGDSAGATYGSRPTRRSTASSTGGTARPLKDGTAVLVHCASTEDPYATVEVRNPNGRDSVLTVKTVFKDDRGSTLLDTSDQVSVPAKGKATVRVAAAGSGRVDEIDHCEVDPRATAVR
ncbi:hypothetical protein ACWD7F_03600 [Streptomyces sp. NPDC005122]